ncbi:nascent polypeptide-associated complex subunit alpha, muscle-specific form-like isoform X2 [Amphibalanus amphitrite]|uniref:nascent polypeptide-associated complex subunit alpha, muscle-specific form-like isoform X2 n=1 Tax=Amphibalanus amphitrite TaxID=1232801 RepID=UPI001C8FBD88|nr:nascent polypeptide-associated complex subunit alpha, muscle-specific form-like isoform X2 [Amphibalanus amphitrite]
MRRPEETAMSGLPLPDPAAEEDDDGLQDRAALLTPARPRPGRRRPRPRPHTAAGRCLPLVKTFTICLSFFTLGLCIALPGPTLLDLQSQVSVSMAQISQLFFWRALGYLAGSMISGLLFDKLNRLLMMLASMALAAAGMATVPWLRSALSLNVCFTALGVPLGFVDTGGNVLLLDLWGKSSGPYMQAIHFSFGLGAFAAPLLAVPFIAHGPAPNGTAAVLFGRNHLHTVNLPTGLNDLTSDPTELPGETISEVIDYVTQPPASVQDVSSVKRDSVEPHYFKLGLALAGGDASMRLHRSVDAVAPEDRPATVQGRETEEVTAAEERKSVVGREGVMLDGKSGEERGGSAGGTESVGDEPTAGDATEQAMGAGVGNGETSAAGTTIVPFVAAVENSRVVTQSADGAVPTGAPVTTLPSEDDSSPMKVILNDATPETKLQLPINATEVDEIPNAAQNASEGAMYDVTMNPNLNITESPLDATTIGSTLNASEPTEEPAMQHTPKPKPVFTDGNKLEHDQTWARPPLKPALHPAPAEPQPPATTPPADTTASPSTVQPVNSTEVSITPSSDGENAASQTSAPDAAVTGDSGKGTGEVIATEGGQEHGNDTGLAQASDGKEGGEQMYGEMTTTASNIAGGTGLASETISDVAAPVDTTNAPDGASEVVGSKLDPVDGNEAVTSPQPSLVPEPSSASDSVSKSAFPRPKLPYGGPIATEPPASGAGSDTSSPANEGRPVSAETMPEASAGMASSGSNTNTSPEAADSDSNPGPISAEVRPAPELSDRPDMDSFGPSEEDWDPEEVVGTEPGLSVPAVPPTAAVPATSPGILNAAPSPTASQGVVESSSGRGGTEQGAPTQVSSPGRVGDTSSNQDSQLDSGRDSNPVSVSSTPDSPSSPPPSLPKPHKPGTYDDTSAEDGLLTRLSSAAAVRGVPPLAQLYLLVSCSLLLVALIFLGLLVYDPRARRAVPSADAGAGPSRCYTGTLVSLMAIVLCFYVGMEVAMGQLLMSFSVHSKVHLSRAGGAYVTSVFWGLFATGRALSVCIAGVLRPAAVLAVNYALVTAGSAVLLAAGSWDRTALLVGGALAGLGMSSVYPAALVWLEQHVHVSSRLAAVLVVAGALGEMLLPAGVGALMAVEPRALTYSLAACTAVCLVMQAVAVVTARVGRPAVGPLQGYQLAAQEEEEDMVDLAKYPGSGEDGSRRLLRM